MAAPQSTPLPAAPQRGEPESVFIPKSNAFVASLEPFRQQLQAQADYIDGGLQFVDATAQAVTDAAQVAEAARDGAVGVSRTYQTASEGIAATADGEYFTVPSSDQAGFLDLYRNDAGSPQYVRTSASSAVADQAEAARDAAQLAEAGAVAAKDKAEGIIGVAGAFADTASGIAGTTDGEYFALSTDGSVWLNNAGVAAQVTDYATLADAIGMISAALDSINGEVV